MFRLSVIAMFSALLMTLTGCVTPPEYYEELTEAEQKQLLHSARVLALQGKAVPDHLRAVFAELKPYQRIVYYGNKKVKASFRWEIYENYSENNRVTQKDINPYWVMVYATGDLTDPKWQLTHAHETPGLQTQSDRPPVRPQRPKQKVRYKR